jgi:hypothetical protein
MYGTHPDAGLRVSNFFLLCYCGITVRTVTVSMLDEVLFSGMLQEIT